VLAELTYHDTDVYYAFVEANGESRASQKILVVVLPGHPLLNVSARGFITPAKPLTVGFVIGRGPRTPDAKRYLIRAVGPSLAKFKVENPVSRPRLALIRKGQPVELSSPRDAEVADISEKVGAAALLPASTDVVALSVLKPGAYTAIASCHGDDCGEVLLEIFEAKPSSHVEGQLTTT
jgi:hypothetical protein